MIVFSLVCSAVFLFGVIGTARSRLGMGGACAAGVVGLFLSLGISPTLILQTFFVLVWCILCLIWRPKPELFTRVTFAITALVYIGMFAHGVRRVREIELARARYPYASLAGRLSYEAGTADGRVPPFSDGKLNELEEQLRLDLGFDRRAYALELLHRDVITKFLATEGFGPIRMLSYASSPDLYVDLPAEPTIPFDAPPQEEHYQSPGNAVEGDEEVQPITARPPMESLEAMHAASYVDFVNPQGFGHVIDQQHVAGFQAHQFRQVPRLNLSDKQQWKLSRLELVSLLKHPRPVAYVTKHLPRMEELEGAPTRPLTGFERTALNEIRLGKDLCTEHGPDHILMLGSLRAAKQCLECHEVERGTLLGAFSYELRRSRPAPKSTPPEDQLPRT